MIIPIFLLPPLRTSHFFFERAFFLETFRRFFRNSSREKKIDRDLNELSVPQEEKQMERRERKMETGMVAIGSMLAMLVVTSCDRLSVGLEDLEEFAADGASDTVEVPDSSNDSTADDTLSDTSNGSSDMDSTLHEDTEILKATDSFDDADPPEIEDTDGSETDPAADEDGCTCVCVCDDGAADSEGSSDGDTDTDADSDADSDADGDADGDADADADGDGEVDSEIDSDKESDDPISGDCLIISEYIEGSSWNKGMEVFNCGDASLLLDGYTLCVYTNDAVECSSDVGLFGTLAAGEVMTICHSSAEEIGVCDLSTGTANFSGDDRAALLRDGVVVDAFGELAVRPEGSPFANITLRRCNATPYLGEGIFALDDYYSASEIDDFSDFGLPPSVRSCD